MHESASALLRPLTRSNRNYEVKSMNYEFYAMRKPSVVIPGQFAALPRTAPGIQPFAFGEKKRWIPGSIAGGADDGPGMTIWVSWRAPAPNRG
jgi:hypothetical protein